MDKMLNAGVQEGVLILQLYMSVIIQIQNT